MWKKNIKKFKVDLGKLSAKERKLFKKLYSITKLIAPLYGEQKNPKYRGANFYPPKTTKKEIKQAAQKNPAILSPYTFVERDKSGDLIAVPFHAKFSKRLKKISNQLTEAAQICEDSKFSKYLEARAQDLLTDDYQRSNILWLDTENSKIGFIIGPFDRYWDKLFFKKRAYMAWLGILNRDQTRRMDNFKKAILAGERRSHPEAKPVELPTLKVRVENTALLSGLVADFNFVGNNLPSSADIELIGKYGSMFTIFLPNCRQKFKKRIWPIFKKYFDPSVIKKYSQQDLKTACLKITVAHEICHSLIRYQDATQRLQELFPFFDELYTDLLGVKSAALLLLKGSISSKEMESLLIAYLCQNIYNIEEAKKRKHLIHYGKGGAVSLNFLLKKGAIDQGKLSPDFTKLFMGIDSLAHTIEYYLSLGKYLEAQKLIKDYGDLDIIKKFS